MSETAVRRLANQPKNKPLLVAFGRLLHEVRHGSPGDMTIAEAAFWEALDERDRAALPHALRAVVGEMRRSARGMVLVPGYWSGGEGTVADPAALLAALTDTAGRLP